MHKAEDTAVMCLGWKNLTKKKKKKPIKYAEKIPFKTLLWKLVT